LRKRLSRTQSRLVVSRAVVDRSPVAKLTLALPSRSIASAARSTLASVNRVMRNVSTIND
jgi:hypothetical protein